VECEGSCFHSLHKISCPLGSRTRNSDISQRPVSHAAVDRDLRHNYRRTSDLQDSQSRNSDTSLRFLLLGSLRSERDHHSVRWTQCPQYGHTFVSIGRLRLHEEQILPVGFCTSSGSFVSCFPQLPQNLFSSGFSAPQLRHFTAIPSGASSFPPYGLS